MTTHINPLIDMINGIAADTFAHTEWTGARNGTPATGENKPAPSGIVRVFVKTNYGTKHFYPANRVAELFLAIQGGKTLTPHSLKMLKQSGYEIEYRYEEIKL